ncbi:MAG: dUTP diphosphatase [Polyangiaceae bacterium]
MSSATKAAGSTKAAARVRVRRSPETADLPLPAYKTKGAAGMDLAAAVTTPISIAPGERKLVGTGLFIALPPGYEGQVRPRSGLAFEHGVTVLNAPGTIDEDYRGELKIVLVNHGARPFVVERGMRIAQLVIARFEQVELELVNELDDTERGAGGYGSTGKHG